MDKVSIVIPVYNAEKNLKTCLDSIVGQTYLELEIIIINDGSTDNSKKICEYYSAKDSRIIFRTIDNNGVSNARNIGISLATGKYLTFVDSDDYLESDAIAKMISLRNEKDADWVIFSRFEHYVDENRVGEYVVQPQDIIIEEDQNRLKIIMQKYLQNEFFCEVWNHLYVTNIIKQNKIEFCKELKIGEDKLFNLLYMLFAKYITVSNQKLYHYVIYSNSTMGDLRTKFYLFADSYLNIAYEFNKYIQTNNMSQEIKNRAPFIYVGLMHQVYYQKKLRHLYDTFHELSMTNNNKKFFISFCKNAIRNKDNIKYYYNISSNGKEHMGDEIIKETILSLKAANKIKFYAYFSYIKIMGKLKRGY